jgi:hypothetical protein
VWVAAERHEASGLRRRLRTLCGDTAWLARRWSERERALASGSIEVALDMARVVANLHPLVVVACEHGGDAGHVVVVVKEARYFARAMIRLCSAESLAPY